MTSPYIRLKLLLAPATAPASASASPSSPASVSYVLKKLEVPRALPVEKLLAKLSVLYGLGAAGGCRLQVALDATSANMEDSQIDRSEKVAALLWEEVRAEDGAAWAAALSGREKVLVRLTPLSVGESTSASSYTPMKLRMDIRPRMQSVIPAKAPGPWPRFQPAEGSLPLIIIGNDDHDWEVLDEEEFERMESQAQKAPCKSGAGAKIAQAAAQNPKVPVSELVAKPHRVVAPELLAQLTGGSLLQAASAEGSPVAAVPNPSTSAITFAVNGATVTVPNPGPSVKLIDYLRYEAGITGQKIGCGEGGCGACMVLLSRTNPTNGQIVQFSTNACLHPLASMEGWAVTTTEGLGSVKAGLHPIQENIVKYWGTQCGYCTPGFVMSMYGLLVNEPTPTAQQVEDRFDGNLCRCTGYRPIFAAMRAVVPGLAHEQVATLKASNGCGGACKCGSGGCGGGASAAASAAPASTCSTGALRPCGKGEGLDCSSGAKAACAGKGMRCGSKPPGRNAAACVDMEDLVLYDPSNPKHNINPFPATLLEHNHTKASSPIRVPMWSADATSLWIVPQSIQDIYSILAFYVPRGDIVKLVGGNTSIGVEKYYPTSPADHPTVFVPVSDVPQLNNVSVQPDALYVGAAVTLTTLISVLQSTTASVPAANTTSWQPVIRHLQMVANHGVRNVATWVGNLMLAKNHPQFPSDLMTVFSALGASLQLVSGSQGLRNVNVVDFGTTQMLVDEFVQTLRIPFTPANYVFDSYKVRSRHQNAHPIINAAYALQYTGAKGPNGMPIIGTGSFIIGGLSQQGVFICKNTVSGLVGKELTPATLALALTALDKEAVAVGRLVPGSTYFISDPAYRHSLVLATFYKFFLEQYAAAGGPVPAIDASAFEFYVRPISSGSVVYVPNPSEKSPLGQAVPKLESNIQATGEAKYIDDNPLPPNGLYGAYVYSTVGVATIAAIDASAALAMPGVVRFISAADIASVNGANDCGSFPGDEEVFASKNITATGQAIGMILADTRAHAVRASKAVNVTYTDVKAPLVTISDAIAANSFFPDNEYMQNPPPITSGDFATAYAAAPMKLSGRNYSGGQPHFYMETQTCQATPSDQDGLYVQSSSQGPTDIRGMVMRVTGLPAHKVVVSTKRIGGGFGGKLSRSHPIAAATSLAARITNRPVRSQCTREADMDMWGKRPSAYMEYEVGFSNDGKITALSVNFYQHGGHTYEANFGAMSMCLLWADSAYYIPNFSVQGKVCRTNTPSNTAMRGPGAMKSIWHMEMIMEAVAVACNMSPDAVRFANFYAENQLTPYGQPVVGITMNTIWDQLKTQANYAKAQTDVAAFNKTNKWRKRGVHMSAVKYGISTPGNQVGLLLNVMQDDGTIIVSHTGVELGQGINTKVAQTIASLLDIDISLIMVDDNATNIVANGSQTGGSATSESACGAAVLACNDLKSRLAPFTKPGMTWPAIVEAAAGGLVNLTVSAQYNIEGPESGLPFTYFVWAASCSQVELDVLTGEVVVLQTDIVYDAGDALNPAVDVGQIEGAFIMGLGNYLTEDVIYDTSNAKLLTRGTWDSHPPCSQDIPLALNVTLLSNSPNNAPLSVLGSKATAEPPMMLSCSVFLAVKDCIAAVRADQGKPGWFDLPTPASTAAVQMACGITPTSLVL